MTGPRCVALRRAVVVAGMAPGTACAHAFGARYDLPLPLWLYLAAAGAAVGLSFLVMTLVLRRPTGHGSGAAAASQATYRRSPWLAAVRAVSVALLLLVVVAAFVGDSRPTGNFATVFVWIVWWVGLVFVQALVVDLWSSVNPFHTVAESARRALSALAVRGEVWPTLRYPGALSFWPAVVLFVAFVWLELVSELGEQPRMLGALIIGYIVITVVGATLFAPERWFTHADPFAVVFRLLGRFAPLGLDDGHGRPFVRVPGHGLLVGAPVPWSLTALVIALLASVSFDGFVETPPWLALLDWVSTSETLRRPLLALQGSGVDLLKLIKTTGLLFAIALFAVVFVVFAWLVDACSGDRRGLRASAGMYVLTLVPIAIGYHVAHYLSYLLIAGQLIIPLASDPFGLGWDLFGTRAYSMDIAIVDARFVWYTAITTIVSGHVIAVYLAHSTALRLHRERRHVVRSQIPMLVLMVGYTMTSLWILSQPIVTT